MMNQLDDLVRKLNSAPPQPIPPEYSDIDLMMGQEYELAVKYLVGGPADRSLVATWTLLTASGNIAMVVTPFEDGDRGKDLVAAGMRKLMREANVIRYTFASEAWMSVATAEEMAEGKPYRPPSERDDRVEIVMITGADKTTSALNAYEIKRDWTTGQITALEKLDKGEMRPETQGRFANLLGDD
jgi:hypothetical protein